MVAVALIVGGFVILAIENYVVTPTRRSKPNIDSLTIKQSLQVGMYQILSLIPGVSRSGATIMGGLVSGIDRPTATAFSFYLSLPILILASSYKLIKDGDKLSQISGFISTYHWYHRIVRECARGRKLAPQIRSSPQLQDICLLPDCSRDRDTSWHHAILRFGPSVFERFVFNSLIERHSYSAHDSVKLII